MRNKFLLNLFIPLITLLLSSVSLAEGGIKVTNISHLHENINILLRTPDDLTDRTCYVYYDILDDVKELQYDQTHNAPTSRNDYVCMHAYSGYYNTQLSIAPIVNVPECEIQIFKYETNIRAGRARASKTCGYTGFCIDGKPYTYENRHLNEEGDPDYESFAKVCLPYVPD